MILTGVKAIKNSSVLFCTVFVVVVMCAALAPCPAAADTGEQLVSLLEERVKIDQNLAALKARKAATYTEWDRLGLTKLAAEIKATTHEIDRLRTELQPICNKQVSNEDEQAAQIEKCRKASAPVNRMVDENNNRREEFDKKAAPLLARLKQIQADEKSLTMQKEDLNKQISRIPNDPHDPLSQMDTVSHIMAALNGTSGDNLEALDNMRNLIIALDDPNNVPAHEAYSYILGLYAAQKAAGVGAQSTPPADPFAPNADDAKMLMNALAPLPTNDAAKNREKEKNADIAIITANRWRIKWVTQAFEAHDGDIEASMLSLKDNHEDGASFAYRYLQGYLAAKDARELAE